MRVFEYTLSGLLQSFIVLSFLSPSLGLAQVDVKSSLLCQSELLKRDVRGDWSDAIFYPQESFEIVRHSDNRGSINERYFSVELRCKVYPTRIDCTHQPSTTNMRISVNRLTGVYESDISSSEGTKSKVRGSCALSGRLSF